MTEKTKNVLIVIGILAIYVALYIIPTPINPFKCFQRRDEAAGAAFICFLAAITIVLQSIIADFKLLRILNYIVGSITILALSYVAFFVSSDYEFYKCLGLLGLGIVMYTVLFYILWRKEKQEKEDQEEIDRKYGKE